MCGWGCRGLLTIHPRQHGTQNPKQEKEAAEEDEEDEEVSSVRTLVWVSVRQTHTPEYPSTPIHPSIHPTQEEEDDEGSGEWAEEDEEDYVSALHDVDAVLGFYQTVAAAPQVGVVCVACDGLSIHC